MRTILLVELLVFVLITTLSCGESTYTEEIVDGIRHVHNHAPLWGNSPKVKLEFVRKIGELEGDDDNYLLAGPTDIIKDSEHNLYIMDFKNYRVQKFDSHGKYMATIGAQGQGPGEFDKSLTMNMCNDSLLYVTDSRNGRIQVFTLNGDYVKTVRMRIQNLSNKVRLYSDGTFVSKTFLQRGTDAVQGSTPLFGVQNENGDHVRGIGNYQFAGHEFVSKLNQTEIETDLNSNLFAAYWCMNLVEKYNESGELLFRTDRPVGFEYNTDPGKFQDIETRFTSIGVDNRNRIWVSVEREIDNDTAGRLPGIFQLDLFNCHGILLMSIPQPVRASRIRVIGDRLFFMDSHYELCVYEYRIIELE